MLQDGTPDRLRPATLMLTDPPFPARPDAQSNPAGTLRKSGGAAQTLGALGVVYGDIGTRPLYTIQEVFGPCAGVPLDGTSQIGRAWGRARESQCVYIAVVALSLYK